jgi:hypothetical protein
VPKTPPRGVFAVPGPARRRPTRIALPGITILRFEAARVVERFSQADMPGLMVQMGAIAAPA